MGGNALKQYNTHRIDRAKYDELSDQVHAGLLSAFGHPGYDIPFYHSKETFGDMDIVVDQGTLPANWIDILINQFSLSKEQWVKNGNVLSFGIHNFQIDLITTPSCEIDSSVHYFSYNDMSNLLGRQHHKLGVKLGHKGLSIIIRPNDNPDHILEDIHLTSDYGVALDIIGLSMEEYLQGFNTLEDMYQFVCKSNYFDPDIYLLDNRNHTSRIRDRKRSSYNGFLTYIKENNIPATYSFKNKTERGGYNIREPYYSELILPRFPWLSDRIMELQTKFEVVQQFKTLYNGKMVSSLTGLQGKELGAFMKTIHFSFETMQYHVAHPDEFLDHFTQFYLPIDL